MKISKNAPLETVDYKIESKYGLLECTFYTENVDARFFQVFSAFADNIDDVESFQKYKERAVEIFAEQFPKRLKELLEETFKETTIRTLIEIKGISRQEAKRRIEEYLKDSDKKKKERMNAPNSGRPAGESKWSAESLREGIIKAVQDIPETRLVTYKEVAKKLTPKTTEEYLRKLIKQHELNWKELRKRT